MTVVWPISLPERHSTARRSADHRRGGRSKNRFVQHQLQRWSWLFDRLPHLDFVVARRRVIDAAPDYGDFAVPVTTVEMRYRSTVFTHG